MSIERAINEGPVDNKPLELKQTFVSILLILICTIAAFHKSLNCYFLADDFSYLANLYSIGSGNWSILLSALTGNFLDVPVMSVYRPMMLVQLLVDYSVWRSDSFGYHLTSLFYYFGSSVILFFWCRTLTVRWERKRSLASSLFCSLLFSTQPLHAECVAWLAGRGDIVCFMFCATSAWMQACYIQNGKRRFLVAASGTFFLALLTKEMAISWVLIIIAQDYYLLTELEEQSKSGFTAAIARSVKRSTPFIALLLVYFVIRNIALGKFLGGYDGTFGDNQLKSALYHWTHIDTIVRLLFPLPLNLALRNDTLMQVAKTICAFLIGGIVAKCIYGRVSPGLLSLLAVLLTSTLLPIISLWGLGPNWEGARFIFFFSTAIGMSLCLFFCSNSRNSDTNSTDSFIFHFAVCIFTYFTVVNIYCANCVMDLWTESGKQIRSVQQEALNLLHSSPTNRFVLLGLPQKNFGVHEIYNELTFKCLMKQPFLNGDYSKRLTALLPVFYSADSRKINGQRLQELLSQESCHGPFVWNSAKTEFEFSECPRSDIEPSEWVKSSTEISGNRFRFDIHKIRARKFAYLRIKGATKSISRADKIRVIWPIEQNKSAVGSAKLDQSTGEQTALICLADYWQWYQQAERAWVDIELNASAEEKPLEIRFESDAQNRPSLTFKDTQQDESGALTLGPQAEVIVSARRIPNAQAMIIEISKPNCFFDSDNQQIQIVNETICIDSPEIKANLSERSISGYCEIRAYAVDSSKRKVGDYSCAYMLH